MTPILQYHDPDGCAFGLIVALEWLCRPYHLRRAPGALAWQTAAPPLRDCRPILRHLATRRRYLLGYPQGTAGHARVEAWLDLLHGEMDAGAARRAAACARLDAALAGKEWLDGRKRTVADAALIGVLRWAVRHAGLALAPYPHLQRHIAGLQGDPAIFFADAVAAGRPAVSSGRFRGHLGGPALALAA